MKGKQSRIFFLEHASFLVQILASILIGVFILVGIVIFFIIVAVRIRVDWLSLVGLDGCGGGRRWVDVVLLDGSDVNIA